MIPVPVHILGDTDLCMQLEKHTESRAAWPVPKTALQANGMNLPCLQICPAFKSAQHEWHSTLNFNSSLSDQGLMEFLFCDYQLSRTDKALCLALRKMTLADLAKLFELNATADRLH